MRHDDHEHTQERARARERDAGREVWGKGDKEREGERGRERERDLELDLEITIHLPRLRRNTRWHGTIPLAVAAACRCVGHETVTEGGLSMLAQNLCV